MAKRIIILSMVLLYGCKSPSDGAKESNVQQDSILRAGIAKSGHSELSGKWILSRSKVRKKSDERIYITFNRNNTAILSGPDSEFERVKWRIRKGEIIIKGLKKSEDSRWTFADSIYGFASSENAKTIELSGKRQAFHLEKL